MVMTSLLAVLVACGESERRESGPGPADGSGAAVLMPAQNSEAARHLAQDFNQTLIDSLDKSIVAIKEEIAQTEARMVQAQTLFDRFEITGLDAELLENPDHAELVIALTVTNNTGASINGCTITIAQRRADQADAAAEDTSQHAFPVSVENGQATTINLVIASRAFTEAYGTGDNVELTATVVDLIGTNGLSLSGESFGGVGSIKNKLDAARAQLANLESARVEQAKEIGQ
jgi:hypothetical protein